MCWYRSDTRGFPDSSVVKNCPAMQETWFDSWVRTIHWRRDRLYTPVFLGFPCDSAGKEYTCNVGDLVSIPALGRSPGEGKSYPLQYSGLENSMDYTVHGVTKSRTRLSDFHTFTIRYQEHHQDLTGFLPAHWGYWLHPPNIFFPRLTTDTC